MGSGTSLQIPTKLSTKTDKASCNPFPVVGTSRHQTQYKECRLQPARDRSHTRGIRTYYHLGFISWCTVPNVTVLVSQGTTARVCSFLNLFHDGAQTPSVREFKSYICECMQFFSYTILNPVRIPNTRPIPRECYLHHLVRCVMVDTIPDSGMAAMHIPPCTSAPSDRKSTFRKKAEKNQKEKALNTPWTTYTSECRRAASRSTKTDPQDTSIVR